MNQVPCKWILFPARWRLICFIFVHSQVISDPDITLISPFFSGFWVIFFSTLCKQKLQISLVLNSKQVIHREISVRINDCVNFHSLSTSSCIMFSAIYYHCFRILSAVSHRYLFQCFFLFWLRFKTCNIFHQVNIHNWCFSEELQLIMVNCSRLSQQMHLLLTYHLHMNGVHLGPDKLLDKLFVISVIISIVWQLQVSTSDY